MLISIKDFYKNFMENLKAQLQEVSNQVDFYKTYSDEIAKEYIALLKSTCQLLKSSESPKNGRRLEKRLLEAVKAFNVEVKDRFDPYFFSMREKKKQDELNYSRLIVKDALKKVIRNL